MREVIARIGGRSSPGVMASAVMLKRCGNREGSVSLLSKLARTSRMGYERYRFGQASSTGSSTKAQVCVAHHAARGPRAAPFDGSSWSPSLRRIVPLGLSLRLRSMAPKGRHHCACAHLPSGRQDMDSVQRNPLAPPERGGGEPLRSRSRQEKSPDPLVADRGEARGGGLHLAPLFAL